MIAKGECWYNAVAESLWSSLKRELRVSKGFRTRAEARKAIVTWVAYYNDMRLHGALDGLSPAQYELKIARTRKQVVEAKARKAIDFFLPDAA